MSAIVGLVVGREVSGSDIVVGGSKCPRLSDVDDVYSGVVVSCRGSGDRALSLSVADDHISSPSFVGRHVSHPTLTRRRIAAAPHTRV